MKKIPDFYPGVPKWQRLLQDQHDRM